MAMTPTPYRHSVTDEYQRAQQSTIYSAAPEFGGPRIMTKKAAEFVIQGGVRPSVSSQETPIVFVMDDDVADRKSLELQICNAGLQSATFETVQEFLCRERVFVPSCLVLSIGFPGLNSLDLQKRLAADRKDMPVIFIVGDADVAMTIQVMRAGAFDAFAKPICNDVLLSTIRQAIELSRTALDREAEISALRNRYASLSRRERDVMTLVASGLLNKQAGFELGISEITVKAHRARVMRKMKAGSLAGLVKMALTLRV
jgi:FixJ family two-component response regulator